MNYDAKNWELLTRYLQNPDKFQDIAPANRAQLVDDAMNLARGGRLDYNVALNITKYLVHETEYVPWKSALNALTFINAMMIKTGDYDKLKVKARLYPVELHDLFAITSDQKYFLELIEPLYNEVGFNDTADSDMLLGYKRMDILSIACHYGLKDCIDRSKTEFMNWMFLANPDQQNP